MQPHLRSIRSPWVLVVLLASSTALTCADQELRELLNPDTAAEHAEQQLSIRLPTQQPDLQEAARGAKPTEPLLVRRLDQLDADYYLVPFSKEGRTTLVVIVDAYDGRFRRVSALGAPVSYPPVDAESAQRILATRIGSESVVNAPPPRLVWKPSHQSQSPYEPLWQFDIGTDDWYVDQRGELWEEIEEPRLKGGGPPPGATDEPDR